MKLSNGWHLAYCTNIHRGESWAQTFDTLQRYTLEVKNRVSPKQDYAIGLRLGDAASRQLLDPENLAIFKDWLQQNQCYVFTINGFPYGDFHGKRVKEQVYLPDWTSPERLDYTQRLFRILAEILPSDVEGSVSTVPASYKEFIHNDEQKAAMRQNLWRCAEFLEQLQQETGKTFHLGLEPEPLCYLETSAESVQFFQELRKDRPRDNKLDRFIGINYDTCHLAIEFEEPGETLLRFHNEGIKLSKIHLSSALKVRPTPQALDALAHFVEPVYFHQVVIQKPGHPLKRIKDLDLALQAAKSQSPDDLANEEWRIHFHIPLHAEPNPLYQTTADHISGLLDRLPATPHLCQHYEMETYTWEVLPSDIKNRDVVDQLQSEYEWTLAALKLRGIYPESRP